MHQKYTLHDSNTQPIHFFSQIKKRKKQEKKTNSHWVQTPFNIQSLKKKLSFLSIAFQLDKLYANYSSEYAKRMCIKLTYHLYTINLYLIPYNEAQTDFKVTNTSAQMTSELKMRMR